MAEEKSTGNSRQNSIWDDDFSSPTAKAEAEPGWKTAEGPNGATYYIKDLVNGRLVVTNTGGITFWPRPI